MDLGWWRMRFQVSVITTVLIVLTPCGVGWAESPEEKGLAIAVEADHRDQGFTDSSATLEMILTNRHGESSNRELRLKTLEVIDTNLGDKSLTIFDRPRDVKGTAFLSFTKILFELSSSSSSLIETGLYTFKNPSNVIFSFLVIK